MNAQYKNSLKKKLCIDICLNGKSTLKTAEAYSIPLKTLEKWITAFNKNNTCFDEEPEHSDFKILNYPVDDTIYDDMSNEELKKLLMKKDIELARLKKNYQVITNGSGEKEFITFSKKNMK